MSSPGQKRGACGHAMAIFDQHAYCARCREKNKGKDPCVESKDTTNCKFCSAFTPEQLAQISTPSYKIKKEKREARKSVTATPTKESTELVDPTSVSVIGVIGQNEPATQTVTSPASSMPPEKKQKKEKVSVKTKKSDSSSSTDAKLADLDSKWSSRFNKLEALLLSRTFQPTFSSEVKLTPAHSPPVNIPRDSEPFFQPSGRTGTASSAFSHQAASQPESDSQSTTTERAGNGSSASQHQPASQLPADTQQGSSTSSKRTGISSSASGHQPASQLTTDRPSSRSPPRPSVVDSSKGSSASQHQPTDLSTTDQKRPSAQADSGCHSKSKHATRSVSKERSNRPVSRVVTDTGSPPLHECRKDSVSSESGSMSDLSDRPAVDLYTEEGELSDDPDCNAEPELVPSEEQTYRETMKGIREYMGWSDIPELDSANTGSDDNPFSGPKAVTPGKVSIQMPTEDWLCKKIAKMNLTLVEGYPSRSSEAGGLLMDHFLRTAKSQSRWYGLATDHKADPAAVSGWCTESSIINSCFSRISRQSGLTSTPPAGRRISQESLRRWEKSAREASVICNQAASFNRCLFRVQKDMQEQLRNLRADCKGKGSSKSAHTMDELKYLMDFNSSISQAAAKTMEHLSEFVFISMGNLTLARRDAYLTHVKSGIKPDTIAALRTAPLHIPTLFPDAVIKRAEEEITNFETKGHSSSSRSKGRYHPYDRPDRKADRRQDKKGDKPAWKNIGKGRYRKPRGKASSYSTRPAKGQQPYK